MISKKLSRITSLMADHISKITTISGWIWRRKELKLTMSVWATCLPRAHRSTNVGMVALEKMIGPPVPALYSPPYMNALLSIVMKILSSMKKHVHVYRDCLLAIMTHSLILCLNSTVRKMINKLSESSTNALKIREVNHGLRMSGSLE